MDDRTDLEDDEVSDELDDDAFDEDEEEPDPPRPVTLPHKANRWLGLIGWPVFLLFGGTFVNLMLQTITDPGDGDDLIVALEATGAVAVVAALSGFVLYRTMRRGVRLTRTDLVDRSWRRVVRYPWSDLDAVRVDDRIVVTPRPGSDLAQRLREDAHTLITDDVPLTYDVDHLRAYRSLRDTIRGFFPAVR